MRIHGLGGELDGKARSLPDGSLLHPLGTSTRHGKGYILHPYSSYFVPFALNSECTYHRQAPPNL